MAIPMGLARHKVDDFEWITRTQVADSFLFVKADDARTGRSRNCSSTPANPGKLRVAAPGSAQSTTSASGSREEGLQMTTVP